MENENEHVSAAVADENRQMEKAVREHLERRVVALNVTVREQAGVIAALEARVAELSGDDDKEDAA